MAEQQSALLVIIPTSIDNVKLPFLDLMEHFGGHVSLPVGDTCAVIFFDWHREPSSEGFNLFDSRGFCRIAANTTSKNARDQHIYVLPRFTITTTIVENQEYRISIQNARKDVFAVEIPYANKAFEDELKAAFIKKFPDMKDPLAYWQENKNTLIENFLYRTLRRLSNELNFAPAPQNTTHGMSGPT